MPQCLGGSRKEPVKEDKEGEGGRREEDKEDEEEQAQLQQ